jgi:hypothetical protein
MREFAELGKLLGIDVGHGAMVANGQAFTLPIRIG